MANGESAVLEERRSLRRKDLLIGVLVTLALALPFLDKPIHIDDPVTLQVTTNILRDPLDPFAGDMDWFGHNLPLWQVTTNPPLLSYWLAPVVACLGVSETALHVAMAPFLLMLALGLRSLSGRFTKRAWLPALFVALSPAVWVSVNLMRDVPAFALLCAGLALCVAGVDGSKRSLLATGSFLCGLAAVTKYSAVLGLPLLVFYLLLQNRTRLTLWTAPAAVPMMGWCLLTWLEYGWVHPLYLLSGSHPNRTFSFFDQSLAAVVIVGSCILLGPPLLAAALRHRPRLLYESLAAGALTVSAAWVYWGVTPRPQAILWFLCGAATLWITLRTGCADALQRPWSSRSKDFLFLAFWAGGFLVFSVSLAPFQAVRHVLPALAPLALLAFRFLDGTTKAPARASISLTACLILQAALGAAVNSADTEYASTYRDFAHYAAGRWNREPASIWYVGHWGWKHYADRAGFRPLHRDGPFPGEGDLLLWPERVHIGDALKGWRGYRERLELVEERVYRSSLPIRTMNFKCAAFYAVVRDNLPYCFQTLPLERMRVYRVKGIH